MARLFYISLLLLPFIACGRNYSPGDPANKSYSLSAIQNDFKLFREILNDCHPTLNFYTSAKRLDKIFDSVYKSIDGETSVRELYNKLTFITNEIQCAHTFVGFSPTMIDTLYNRKLFFPLPVIWIEGKLMVNSDADLDHGTEILKINGVPVDKIMDALMIYNPVDGPHRETQKFLVGPHFSFDYYTRFGGEKEFTILTRDSSGAKETEVLNAVDLNEFFDGSRSLSYFNVTDVDYSLDIQEEDKYAVMRLNTFKYVSYSQQTAFENFLTNSFDLLNRRPEIKTLVIDLRDNAGGDLYNCFLLYSFLSAQNFAEYSEVHSRISRVRYVDYLADEYDADKIRVINQQLDSGFRKVGSNHFLMADSSIGEWEPDKLRFTKTLYIITNHEVMSSASYFVVLAKNSGRAKIIGSETAGSDYAGSGFKDLKYTLPKSQLRFGFSYAKMNYTLGEQKKPEGGIIPDFNVPDTYKSFLSNEDRQLFFIRDSLILKK